MKKENNTRRRRKKENAKLFSKIKINVKGTKIKNFHKTYRQNMIHRDIGEVENILLLSPG